MPSMRSSKGKKTTILQYASSPCVFAYWFRNVVVVKTERKRRSLWILWFCSRQERWYLAPCQMTCSRFRVRCVLCFFLFLLRYVVGNYLALRKGANSQLSKISNLETHYRGTFIFINWTRLSFLFKYITYFIKHPLRRSRICILRLNSRSRFSPTPPKTFAWVHPHNFHHPLRRFGCCSRRPRYDECDEPKLLWICWW